MVKVALYEIYTEFTSREKRIALNFIITEKVEIFSILSFHVTE